MKHSEEYYQVIYVLKNTKEYDKRMVSDARNYVRGYRDALKQVSENNIK